MLPSCITTQEATQQQLHKSHLRYNLQILQRPKVHKHVAFDEHARTLDARGSRQSAPETKCHKRLSNIDLQRFTSALFRNLNETGANGIQSALQVKHPTESTVLQKGT